MPLSSYQRISFLAYPARGLRSLTAAARGGDACVSHCKRQIIPLLAFWDTCSYIWRTQDHSDDQCVVHETNLSSFVVRQGQTWR